jgi:hypothetical protein
MDYTQYLESSTTCDICRRRVNAVKLHRHQKTLLCTRSRSRHLELLERCTRLRQERSEYYTQALTIARATHAYLESDSDTPDPAVRKLLRKISKKVKKAENA